MWPSLNSFGKHFGMTFYKLKEYRKKNYICSFRIKYKSIWKKKWINLAQIYMKKIIFLMLYYSTFFKKEYAELAHPESTIPNITSRKMKLLWMPKNCYACISFNWEDKLWDQLWMKEIRTSISRYMHQQLIDWLPYKHI